MLDSFINFIKNPTSDHHVKSNNDNNLILVCGILLEAASIDGRIDNNEILRINHSLIDFFKINEEKSNNIVKKCLGKVDDQNSFHYFTSRINKEYEYNKKIIIIEMLWEIVLVDGKIHDFESNLIRRLAGLLYISDVNCGNAKKRALVKLNKVDEA